MRLFYTKEAKEWTQALPIGNGHMGAMCYGGAGGRYDLSENTCWSGGAQEKYLQEDAAQAMEQARRLFTEKNPAKAHELLEKCVGIKTNYGTQVPMGRLVAAVEAVPVSSKRELDLTTGVAKDKLIYSDKTVRRESFLSNPAKVMGVRLFAEGKVMPTICLWVEGASQPCNTQNSGNSLLVKGRALENIHSDGITGVSYTIALHFETDGKVSWNRRGLVIENATALTIYLTATTSMFDSQMEETCQNRLAAAMKKGWDALLSEHIEEHSNLMNQCTLMMGDDHSDIPTDERIAAFAQNPTDLDLIASFFQYGRYLLMNSTRADSLLPAALQGVWNDNRACRMEWTDDMHLDINTQMNYYPAEVTGLSECTLPLHEWVKNALMPNGKKIAKELYSAEGWCAHGISNAFGWAAPGWDVSWGFAATCGGWVATHIWEHYLFTKDKDFLNEYYEVLYGAAQFLNSILTLDPDSGELVTNPSNSPENSYFFEGKTYSLTTGSRFDINIVKKIFDITLQAAKLLGKQDSFIDSLCETAQKLPPFKIGKHGQLQEWNADFDEPTPDHRHTSHLLATHPFNLTNPQKDTALGQAIRTSLDRRLGENAEDIVLANWAGALLITYYARLLEGEKAGDFVKPMISFLSRDNMMITHQGPTTSVTGGIYELDGNTGFTAAVAEMLIQSYTGEIHILPAIPTSWDKGCVSGLRCYDGHTVNITWEKTAVIVDLLANADGEITVVHKGEKKLVEVKKGETYTLHFTL